MKRYPGGGGTGDHIRVIHMGFLHGMSEFLEHDIIFCHCGK